MIDKILDWAADNDGVIIGGGLGLIIILIIGAIILTGRSQSEPVREVQYGGHTYIYHGSSPTLVHAEHCVCKNK